MKSTMRITVTMGVTVTMRVTTKMGVTATMGITAPMGVTASVVRARAMPSTATAPSEDLRRKPVLLELVVPAS